MWLRILIVGLLISLGLQACKEPYVWHANNITGAAPDLEFSLVDSDARQIDAQSLRGKLAMVFFGFTHCPDVCPTTLAQLKVVINKLGQEANNIQIFLVSVDPQRDTPAVMKDYTAGFGPWLHGLTGSEEDVDELRIRFGIYASMQSSDDKGDYNVMHNAAVFVFDAEGKARLLFTDVTNSDAVVADIQQLINQ